MQLAKARKIRAARLPVSAPFHCDLLKPAALADVVIQGPDVPVYMNVDGEAETDGTAVAEKLVMQARLPVY